MPQLLASERMAPEQLRKLQYAQLHALLTHAFERSEFWRQRLTGIGWSPREGTGPQVLQRLPVLTRSDLQEHFEALHARPLPAAFGKTGMTESSGATGKSVRVMKCAVQSYLYDAITLRDHLWHKRDFSRKIGVLKPNGNRPPRADWGRPVAAMYRSGPTAFFDNLGPSIEEQLDWLVREQPDYLVAGANRLLMLAELAKKRDPKVRSLQGIMTYGGVVTPLLRDLVQSVFGTQIADWYSSEETGYIASQCPNNNHYHLQAETVIIELVDEDDAPVADGQMGRVLVTVLHSFAMPLIRYQIGDLAIAGRACDCGRTLPVLARIIGRELLVLRLPDGRSKQIILLAREFSKFAPIKEFRVVMYSDQVVDVFVVCEQPIGETPANSIIRMVQTELGYPFPTRLKQVSQIDWGRSWKREPFTRVSTPSA